MNNSARPKIIHVMSAGAGLTGTFPVALKRFQMDEVLIMTDVKGGGGKEDKSRKVGEAVDEIVRMAQSVHLKMSVVEVDNLSIGEIMTKFITTYAKNPSADYYFNVTGGKKPLALGLFMASVWVGGKCYYIEEGNELSDIQELQVPRMHLNDVRNNPNYENMLVMLDADGKTDLKLLYEKMQQEYVPMRSIGGNKKRNFSRPTMTKWIKQLAEWDLIDVREGRNQREKEIILTDSGRFTAKFIAATKQN